ncbi:hypothetical protein BC355_08915 [Vibrio cholerae]|uniref:Uncharacterized protein n=1 Tax=Vibrio cholerae TaxID=666 RepID=A0A395TYI8_VIBCL|nr:hypothetical protein [Vibrio cholerae]EGR0264011.1 hypothetical protein [Vibrio cholerae]EGR0524957.1 hypothetical protein [Vibrio cholerae]EGR0592918.1 hypothetical protein [Vibrio cholerae]EGR0600825.1 hypothetical protein [Vibrio cholerae]EGZ6889835.1 hypothetical protein [Vibrio cholerae]
MTSNERIKNLQELSTLDRQSMCMQFLLLLNLCDKGLAPSEIKSYTLNEKTYFDSKTMKEHLAESSLANAHKGLYALYQAHFIERLVVDKNGEIATGDNYQRNTAMIYWRLTEKARSLLD